MLSVQETDRFYRLKQCRATKCCQVSAKQNVAEKNCGLIRERQFGNPRRRTGGDDCEPGHRWAAVTVDFAE